MVQQLADDGRIGLSDGRGLPEHRMGEDVDSAEGGEGTVDVGETAGSVGGLPVAGLQGDLEEGIDQCCQDDSLGDLMDGWGQGGVRGTQGTVEEGQELVVPTTLLVLEGEILVLGHVGGLAGLETMVVGQQGGEHLGVEVETALEDAGGQLACREGSLHREGFLC